MNHQRLINRFQICSRQVIGGWADEPDFFRINAMNGYDKLRPAVDVESCECGIVTSLLLIAGSRDNPIHCDVCLGEVDPERIQLTADVAETVAFWFWTARAWYQLWLNSGEYETYARERLLDPSGQINVEGRQTAKELSARIPTQLWCFHDMDDGNPTVCPVCRGRLDEEVRRGAGQCAACYVRI